MEALLREHTVAHLQDNNLITPNHHGFVQGRSCPNNLL